MKETVQQKKARLLADFVEVRHKILDLASSLALEKRSTAYLGEWDIADMLAHLSGWDDTNMQAIDQLQSGEVPEFYQYSSPDWRIYNAHLVAKYRLDDLDALVNFVSTTQQRLVARAAAIPAVELFRDRDIRFKGYKITIARLLEAELKDERVHLAQLEAFAAS